MRSPIERYDEIRPGIKIPLSIRDSVREWAGRVKVWAETWKSVNPKTSVEVGRLVFENGQFIFRVNMQNVGVIDPEPAPELSEFERLMGVKRNPVMRYYFDLEMKKLAELADELSKENL